MLDHIVGWGVIMGFIFFIYTKFKRQTARDTWEEIKELWRDKAEE